jgi:hypothetical protein
LLACTVHAQTITTQPTDQNVQAGQTATFSVSFTGGGSCRSIWYTGAIGNHYGVYGPSPISYSIPNVTAAMNGTTVTVGLFGCSGEVGTATSVPAHLTVGPPPTFPVITIEISALYDDGTVPPGCQLIVNNVLTNADGTTTSFPVLTMAPDPVSGIGIGTVPLNPALTYSAGVYRNGVLVGQQAYWPVAGVLLIMPTLTQTNFDVVLFKTTGQIKSFRSGAS